MARPEVACLTKHTAGTGGAVQATTRKEQRALFFHTKQFQYNAKPDNPDPIFAKRITPEQLTPPASS
jgi:hypothetical protein